MKNHLTQTLLICTAALSFYILIQITNLALRQPSTELIALAVIATIEARPPVKPMVVEVPVTVEVTRIVPVLAPATLPPPTVPVLPPANLSIQPTPTPVPPLPITPTGQSVAAGNAPPVADAVLPTATSSAPHAMINAMTNMMINAITNVMANVMANVMKCLDPTVCRLPPLAAPPPRTMRTP